MQNFKDTVLSTCYFTTHLMHEAEAYLGPPKHLRWMELFITLVKDFQALTNVTKNFILDIAESLDMPLNGKKRTYILKKL